jgi:hypothetical protein
MRALNATVSSFISAPPKNQTRNGMASAYIFCDEVDSYYAEVKANRAAVISSLNTYPYGDEISKALMAGTNVMNEWDLQAALTDRWLKDSPEIAPYGRLDLVAWEVMFPSWDINYKATRWNEPSLDFVFLDERGEFVLVELKNVIPNRSGFLSAFCQISHRAVQFIRTYSPDQLRKASSFCMDGACGRLGGIQATVSGTCRQMEELSLFTGPNKVHRVIAAAEFPKHTSTLLEKYNRSSFQDLVALIGVPAKSAKEKRRFCNLTETDFEAVRANGIVLYQVELNL